MRRNGIDTKITIHEKLTIVTVLIALQQKQKTFTNKKSFREDQVHQNMFARKDFNLWYWLFYVIFLLLLYSE